jgi:hypothetical protein
MSKPIKVELTKAQVNLILGALESYTYWEIGDMHTRNDGYFREDWCDPEEDAEALDSYAEVCELESQLIDARKKAASTSQLPI